MADAVERLERLLGAPPPAAVRDLPEPARTEFAALLEDARRRQAATLAEAFQATLRHVPFPLRKIASKVLLG